MEPTLYQTYIDALNKTNLFVNKAGMTMSADRFKIEDILRVNKEKKDEITLCIKNYKVGGLSNAIHTRHQQSIFNVSGPMGRPLNIQLHRVNVAFVAGTGVLPFMDLVGFIARQTLECA